MLTDFLKPPVQPIYPPGYRKPSRPSIDDLAGRATQAKEANKEYLDAISDTYRRIRQQSAAYFTRDEVAFRSGQIEPYPSTTLVDALNKLVAYIESKPLAFTVDVYDPTLVEDAQKIEDMAYHFRSLHERRWVKAGNPTLSHAEAHDLATFGVVISRRTLNLADTKCPILTTLVDPATVFPVWGRVGLVPSLEAVYRMVTMPVHQAIADFVTDPELKAAAKDAVRDRLDRFGESADVTVVEYWDSWWCCAFLVEGNVPLKPLTAHEYGCVPFIIQYGPGGEPMHTRAPDRSGNYVQAGAFGGWYGSGTDRPYKATGYLESKKKLSDFRDALTSLYVTNAIKGFNQPVILKRTNTAAESERPFIDRSPGGETELVAGEEDLLPFPTSPNPNDMGMVMQMLMADSQTNLSMQSFGEMPDKSNISGTAQQRSVEASQIQSDAWVRSMESFHGRCATHDMHLWRNFGHESRYLSGQKKSFFIPRRNPMETEAPSFELTPEVIDNVDTEITCLMDSMSMTEMMTFGQVAQMFGPQGMGIWSNDDIARKMGKTDYPRTKVQVQTDRMMQRVQEMEETGKLILVPQALMQAIKEAEGNPELQGNLTKQLLVWQKAVMEPMMAQLQQASQPQPPPGMAPGGAPPGPPQPGQGIAGGSGAPYALMGQGPGSVSGVQGGPRGPLGPREGV